MSKIYDAIMKAQREREIQKKGKEQVVSVLEPGGVEATKGVTQKTPILGDEPQITPKRTKSVALFPRKSVTHVEVEQTLTNPNSLMAEQFRKLRNLVTTHNLASSLRSLLITSCMPGEGKTKVTMNLAATIAKGLDDSVILIDADLRRKRLSSLLGLAHTAGLSDVLEGKTVVQETFVSSESR
jgi:Mrp family chromosome partitioning ATPase